MARQSNHNNHLLAASTRCAVVLQLLAGEDRALLVRRDALLALDLGLDVLDAVRGRDLEGEDLAGEDVRGAKIWRCSLWVGEGCENDPSADTNAFQDQRKKKTEPEEHARSQGRSLAAALT
jgi:hypothetical protein